MFALINMSIGSIWGFDIKEMPVFEPNEYFWKHHWDGKEPKWEAYARVVQKLVAEQQGMKVSNLSMEDKLEYKALMKKAKQDKNDKHL